MEANGVPAPFPRVALEEAFKRQMVAGNEVWKAIADARSLSTHTYDQKLAQLLCKQITDSFVSVFLETVEKIRPFV